MERLCLRHLAAGQPALRVATTEILFVGSPQVGKSTLIRALFNSCPVGFTPSPGILRRHQSRSRTEASEEALVVIVWTAATCADGDSLEAYVRYWMQRVRRSGRSELPLAVVATQSDWAPCPLPMMHALQRSKTVNASRTVPALAVSARRGTNIAALWRMVGALLPAKCLRDVTLRHSSLVLLQARARGHFARRLRTRRLLAAELQQQRARTANLARALRRSHAVDLLQQAARRRIASRRVARVVLDARKRDGRRVAVTLGLLLLLVALLGRPAAPPARAIARVDSLADSCNSGPWSLSTTSFSIPAPGDPILGARQCASTRRPSLSLAPSPQAAGAPSTDSASTPAFTPASTSAPTPAATPAPTSELAQQPPPARGARGLATLFRRVIGRPTAHLATALPASFLRAHAGSKLQLDNAAPAPPSFRQRAERLAAHTSLSRGVLGAAPVPTLSPELPSPGAAPSLAESGLGSLNFVRELGGWLRYIGQWLHDATRVLSRAVLLMLNWAAEASGRVGGVHQEGVWRSPILVWLSKGMVRLWFGFRRRLPLVFGFVHMLAGGWRSVQKRTYEACHS